MKRQCLSHVSRVRPSSIWVAWQFACTNIKTQYNAGRTARTYLFLHMTRPGPGGWSCGAFCAPALFFAIAPSERSKMWSAWQAKEYNNLVVEFGGCSSVGFKKIDVGCGQPTTALRQTSQLGNKHKLFGATELPCTEGASLSFTPTDLFACGVVKLSLLRSLMFIEN